MKRLCRYHGGYSLGSPPVRGAWIETNCLNAAPANVIVAPRAGGVD